MHHSRLLIVIAVVLIGMAGHSCADSTSFAHRASDSIGPFLALGEVILYPGDKHEASQGAKALIATSLATELLKATVREKRSNSNSRTSFPSGHTSAAFAMATVLADFRPRLAEPAYAIASVIGWSRVELDAHRWSDVIAGAALGHLIAKHFTKQHVELSTDGIEFGWSW